MLFSKEEMILEMLKVEKWEGQKCSLIFNKRENIGRGSKKPTVRRRWSKMTNLR